MTMTIEQWRTRADKAETERDKYKNACVRAGVCMSCVLGSPEPYGCTDCLNTGWDQGAPYEAREALAEITRLQIENFALAANQCHDGYSDEGGSHRCKEVDKAKIASRIPMAAPDENSCWYGVEHCTLPHCDCANLSSPSIKTKENN